MAGLNFTAEIKIRGINPYVLVSAERAKKLKDGWRKSLPVLMQVNGKLDEPWPINMMPVGDGSFYLYLSGNVREASHTKVGDKVQINVWFDDAYEQRRAQMPDWFKPALDKNKKALASWDELTPSRQKEVLRYFASLKSDEARSRNLEKIMHILTGKQGRFMARPWKDGK